MKQILHLHGLLGLSFERGMRQHHKPRPTVTNAERLREFRAAYEVVPGNTYFRFPPDVNGKPVSMKEYL